jgi:hypothetical protein
MMPGMNFRPCDLVGIPFPSIVSEKKFAPILGVKVQQLRYQYQGKGKKRI